MRSRLALPSLQFLLSPQSSSGLWYGFQIPMVDRVAVGSYADDTLGTSRFLSDELSQWLMSQQFSTAGPARTR